MKQGQLLLVIDEEPFQVKLDQAKAQLAEAEAALETAEHSKIREVAQAQEAFDEALYLLSRIEEARTKTLLSRTAASKEDVDRAEANRKKNEAQVQSDLASLEQAKADYETNILAAKAQVATAKTQVRDAEINLGYCRMTAPIDGRIGEALVKVGNLVGAGDDTALATIEQLDPIGVDIRPSSRYLARATELIQNGLTVNLIRPSLQGEEQHKYPGKAIFIDNTIDPTTSTFLVKASVPNPEKTLLPGEYVKVNLNIGEYRDAVVVPEQSVIESQVGQTVYVVKDDSTVEVARVEAVDTYNGLRVLQSGLKPGQKVIVEGLQLVRPGMKVQVKELGVARAARPARGVASAARTAR